MSNNSINNRYVKEIEELVNARPVPELEDRKKAIEDITERYFQETGNILPATYITKLTDWFLADELGNRDNRKVQKQDYPILTKNQERRRNRQVFYSSEEGLDLSYNRREKKDRVITGKVITKNEG